MLITQKNIDATYKFIGFEHNKDKIKQVLQSFNPNEFLDKSVAKKWSQDNPFRGYSQYIAEFVYFYIAPKGSTLKKILVKEGRFKHYLWFVEWPDETVVDLTLQLNSERPEYEKSIKAKFNESGPNYITKMIAEKLGYSDEDLDI